MSYEEREANDKYTTITLFDLQRVEHRYNVYY